MKAARLHGPGDIRVADEPAPIPGPGEVLVRVTAVGICGSDLHWLAEGGIGPDRIVEPLVLGHECAGVIESGARIRRTIVDKFVRVGRHARIGAIGRAGEPPLLTTLGKNAVIPDHAIVPAGASAAADATAVEFVPAKERPPV